MVYARPNLSHWAPLLNPPIQKDFAPKDENILHYDDYNQLAEAGNQIIALVQAGCKSEKSGRDISK